MINVKAKEILGWTALLTVFTAMVAGLGSLVYTPPSSMRGQDGRKFSLFEHVFKAKEIKAENRSVLEESISKALVEKAQDRKDSIAAVQRAHNDSIKAAMAKKKMKPRAQAPKQQMRVPQKH